MVQVAGSLPSTLQACMSSWLSALAWPSPSSCWYLGNESAIDRYLGISLPLPYSAPWKIILLLKQHNFWKRYQMINNMLQNLQGVFLDMLQKAKPYINILHKHWLLSDTNEKNWTWKFLQEISSWIFSFHLSDSSCSSHKRFILPLILCGPSDARFHLA